MQKKTGTLGLSRHLAQRLYPLTLLIGILISVGVPATYYILESLGLQRVARLYAQDFARQLQGVILESPALWKYQAQRYTQVVHEFLPYKDVTTVQILDEAGRPITGYTYATERAETWWNRFAPEGSAPIVFNNRTIGAVRVGVSRGRLLGATLSMLFVSVGLGVGLAILVYTFPVKVVTRLEGRIQELMETVQQANAELEARVEERTRELLLAYADLQEALRKAKEASRAKAEFLSNISHELRTPLNAIIGFSELLQQQTPGVLGEREARYIGHIHQAGKHLFHLITTILEFSNVEAGELTLQPVPVPVAETLEDVLLVTRGIARKKAQTVEARIEAALPPLLADPLRFKQVCFNLLSNAVKFTPEGGTITLTARRLSGQSGDLAARQTGTSPECQVAQLPDCPPADWLELKVADTGIGIKAEDLPRLFREFVQLDDPVTKRHEGVGLGLAFTRKMVELHGGRIWAESEGEGRGSTFAVILPFAGVGPNPTP